VASQGQSPKGLLLCQVLHAVGHCPGGLPAATMITQFLGYK